MVMGAMMHHRFLLHFCPILNQCLSGRSVSSLQNLEQAVRAELENLRVQIVDEMLQSFIPIRPRSKPQLAYSYLLSYTLQSSHPFPLALAVLQWTSRSGCLPVPQSHVLLSSAWLDQHCLSHSVANILLQMQSIGYHPDCGTFKVLRGMGGAGCVPDSSSYGTVIGAMSRVRKTAKALDLMKQMGTLVKLLAALRANREIWKAVEMIEFLEKEGNSVGFESYELVIEGCFEKREYVLAAKAATGMTEKGLANIDEWKLACAVGQRFAALKS
ncbi:Pentatricopeptide repeat-containing protein [Glycine soja]|uniref:Pentatricopeptide repeat-containing protein n=1 Tax=Glycine soja TaxID=3848 RepID=A0A445IC30_GLYSO|nr:Pentatricopeptide repeat-containing protein [Glycine soja]